MLYDEYVATLPIERGDRLWISSELVQLAFLFKRKGERFDASKLIDAFQTKVGEEGTLLIPTFCFDFSNIQYYDYKNSKGTAGALGNVALKRDDFARTKHPMHSFAVWGKDKQILYEMNNRHAFGEDSPFRYCKDNHVKQVIIGTDYVHALTFVHYVETVCNVPYRFPKQFTGTYITEEGEKQTRTYDYAARKLEINPEERINRIGVVMEKRGVAHRYTFHDHLTLVIDLTDSYDIIKDDIVNNQCRNIYDFNIPREEVFGV